MASALSPSHLLPKTPIPKSHLPPFFHSTSPLLLLRPPPKTLTLRLHHLPPPAAAAVHFEDLVEKDWSFLEPPSPEEEWAPKARRIISAAAVDGGKGRTRVMVSMGSERFVDKLAEECPCELLLAIHDSLFVLAMIKERHDGVRCWQGPIGEVPDKFLPLDAVFVCYFPGMGLFVEALLQGLAGRISPGARVVISFDQGREFIEQVLRKEYPDMVTSDLPDRDSLIDAANTYLFQLVEFVDDPTFYLAVLEFRGS